MSKQVRNIIITAAVLLVLGGATAFLMLYNPDTETDPGDTSTTTSTTTVRLIDIEEADIASIDVAKGGESYTIVVDAENGSYLEGHKELPTDSSRFTSIISIAKSLTAMEEVDASGISDADAGLSPAACTYTVHQKDGTSTAFQVGGMNGFGTGYYVRKQGEDKLYLVSTYTLKSMLEYNLYSFVSLSLAPTVAEESITDINKVEISGPKRSDVLGVRTLTDAEVEESRSLNAYMIVSPKEADVNSDSISTKLLNKLLTFTATAAVDADVSEANLAKYGLADPGYKLYFEIKEEGYTFYFGDTAEDGSVYGMREGYPVVYSFAADTVDFLGVNVTDVMSRLALFRYIDSFDSIVVETGGKTTTIKTSGDMDALVVESGGETLDTDNFRQFYMIMMGILMQGDAEPPAQGAQVLLRVTYNYRDGGRPDVVEYVELNARQCFVRVNGEDLQYCMRKDVEQVAVDLDKLLKGEEVKAY